MLHSSSCRLWLPHYIVSQVYLFSFLDNSPRQQKFKGYLDFLNPYSKPNPKDATEVSGKVRDLKKFIGKTEKYLEIYKLTRLPVSDETRA